MATSAGHTDPRSSPSSTVPRGHDLELRRFRFRPGVYVESAHCASWEGRAVREDAGRGHREQPLSTPPPAGAQGAGLGHR